MQTLFDAFVAGRLYWFAYCIFLMYLTAPLFWDKPARTAGCCILCVLLNVVLIVVGQDLGQRILNINGYKDLLLYQPFNFISSYPFFLIGMIIKQCYEKISSFEKKNRNALTFIGYVGTLASIALIAFNVGNSNIPGYGLRYVRIAVTSYALLSIVRCLPVGIKVLEMIAKYSLHIMFFDAFYRTVLIKIIGTIYSTYQWLALPLALIVVVLSCLSCEIIKNLSLFVLFLDYKLR